MLGNCEQMVLISSTTNEWPQNHIDEKSLMASTTRVMVANTGQQQQQQQQQQQEALKCPRCDSSNTKFCYYNNYSLSQPRHFCKACKRYWTRGGTLRNVPVGGGCRKNKRVKRPISAVDPPSSSSAPNSTPNPNPIQPHIDLSSTSNHVNPLIYGLPTNPSELNLPYPRFNSRVSNGDMISGYDLQPQMNALGLGFSNSVLPNYPIFGSSTSTTPTMASLLASSFQQQRIISGGLKDIRTDHGFLGLVPYEEMEMPGRGDVSLERLNIMGMKEVKMEETQNRFDWNVPCNNQMEQIGSSDPSLMWNTSGIGGWLDPSNIGSSVPSLI